MDLLLVLLKIDKSIYNKIKVWLDEAEIDYDFFCEIIRSHCLKENIQIYECNLLYFTLYSIIYVANVKELIDYINIDKITIDIFPDEAGFILSKIPHEERNSSWEWLVNFTSAEIDNYSLEDEYER